MRPPDPLLIPDWDEFNIAHISRHGVSPEQVEEVYYGDGPLPTLAVRTRARWPSKTSEDRCRFWGTDASGILLEVIVAIYPEVGVWRCVTAYRMSQAAGSVYLRRIRR